MKPTDFLKEYRLNEALQLIEEGEIINIIASRTGFSSHSYFDKCCKQRYGYSPIEIQRHFNKIKQKK